MLHRTRTLAASEPIQGWKKIIFGIDFQTISNHLHPVQVENCDSNSRLVMDEDDNGEFRLESANLKREGFLVKASLWFSRLKLKWWLTE